MSIVSTHRGCCQHLVGGILCQGEALNMVVMWKMSPAAASRPRSLRRQGEILYRVIPSVFRTEQKTAERSAGQGGAAPPLVLFMSFTLIFSFLFLRLVWT